jgi:hypothetical protein
MWQELNSTIRNALLFMLDEAETKDCHDFLLDAGIQFQRVHPDTISVNIIVDPHSYKKYKNDFTDFKGIIQHAFLTNHNVVASSIDIITDWTKLEILSSRILPTPTPWDDINERQRLLIRQTEAAAEADSFRNIGNTARHLLLRLAEIVFDAEKHTSQNNKRDLGPAFFKNRLWAFIQYKLSGGSGNSAVKDYIQTILESSDKAIDLSNTTTHALNADAFLAQSCAISTITTVHLVKLVHEMPDPK